MVGGVGWGRVQYNRKLPMYKKKISKKPHNMEYIYNGEKKCESTSLKEKGGGNNNNNIKTLLNSFCGLWSITKPSLSNWSIRLNYSL